MPVEFTGLCRGGPLAGSHVTVRSDPFLAADKAAGKLWLYKRQADGTFAVCTDHDASLQYPTGATSGERALDWDRLPLSTDTMDVVSLGSSPEAYAGDPVDDGWNSAPNLLPDAPRTGSNTDFYEADEPVADALAAFDAAPEKGKTAPPRGMR